MTIEIKKKHLVILGIIAAIIICIVGGFVIYSLGYYVGYEKGDSSGFKAGEAYGIAVTERKYENPKGDGSEWYAETVNNGADFLYHSTSICPNIRNGIRKNWGFINPKQRKQRSQFCSKCMDAFLIKKCEDYLYDDKEWK